MRVRRFGAGLLLAGALAAPPAAAQDSHYWTNQYGTRAELLGGQVVGSIKDLSCVYYNPGAMALVESPELVLTTDAFQIEVIDFEGSRRDTGLRSTESGKAPSIFAIRIDSIEPLGTRGIALSYVTRHDFRAKLGDVEITPADQPIPGQGFLSAEGIFEQKLYEAWFGATLARRYGSFGVGATLFAAYRSQSGRSQTLAARTDGTSGGSSVILVDSFRYWHTRLLAKIGVSWDRTDFTFGVAVTTPGVSALNDASVLTTVSLTNVQGGSGTAGDELVADSQKNLGATFKAPPSIAVGGSWRFRPNSILHVSAEYFLAVSAYKVIEAAPFTGQSTGSRVERSVENASRSAFNWGFGYEHVLTQAVSLYGGFWVDRSTTDPGLESELSVTTWDLHHVTLGSNFTVRSIRLTLGISYARGSDPIGQILDLESIGLQGTRERTGDVTFQRLKGIIGVSFEV